MRSTRKRKVATKRSSAVLGLGRCPAEGLKNRRAELITRRPTGAQPDALAPYSSRIGPTAGVAMPI